MNNRFRQALLHALRRNAWMFAALALTLGVYFFLPGYLGVPQPVPSAQEAAVVLAHSEPVRLRIPSIGVDAAFEEPLGVDADKEIEVPRDFDTVGWYKYGPTPGELGPAVVLGHVDSYKGPEVFYSLRKLAPGERIEIDRTDGTTATFEVTRLETVSQSAFPTEEVYGNIDHAGLRLITCSGVYDHGTRRYSHNLIVFARLIDTPAS